MNKFLDSFAFQKVFMSQFCSGTGVRIAQSKIFLYRFKSCTYIQMSIRSFSSIFSENTRKGAGKSTISTEAEIFLKSDVTGHTKY